MELTRLSRKRAQLVGTGYKDIREITTLKDLLAGSVESTVRDLLLGKKKNVVEEYIPSYEVLGHDVEAIGTMLLELVDERRCDHWRGAMSG